MSHVSFYFLVINCDPTIVVLRVSIVKKSSTFAMEIWVETPSRKKC